MELLLFLSQTAELVVLFTLSLLLNFVMSSSKNGYVIMMFLMFKSVSGIQSFFTSGLYM
jgi:hypothetical protein